MKCSKKGTKVDIGVPYELWDKPSVEITQLQKQCFRMVEEFEDDLEDWYMNEYDDLANDNDSRLTALFCKGIVLRNKDTG